MSNDDRANEVQTDRPASTALAPFAPRIEPRARRRSYRWTPDPTFVAHLIAAAQQVPQARTLRRGSVADAQAAYGTSRAREQGAGSQLRQIDLKIES